jgi:hypothetical protein
VAVLSVRENDWPHDHQLFLLHRKPRRQQEGDWSKDEAEQQLLHGRKLDHVVHQIVQEELRDFR